MESDIRSYLEDIGCCWRCVFIFLGQSKQEYFYSTLTSTPNFDEIFNGATENDTDQVESFPGLNCPRETETISTHISKKLRLSICISCLGLLQTCESTEVIEKLSNTVKEGDYDAKCFSLGVSLPLCLPLRIHIIWAHLIRKFPNRNAEEARIKHVGILKDIWRSLAGPHISSVINKEYISGQLAPLNLAIQMDYIDSEKECLLLEKIDGKKFILRRKQFKKYSEGLFTNQVIKETLSEIKDKELLHICEQFPSVPKEPFFIKQIICTHTSVYLAGRYNKFSRALPQTPWFVSEDRRFDSSVQELICGPLNEFIRAEGIKFSSSGREDVDVRCLGRGRPFVIEFVNPHRSYFNDKDLELLQKKVNQSSEDISIKDLQAIEKKDTSNLKEGEDEKTKSYSALCFSKEDVSSELLGKLQTMKDIVLDQMTPLRVLHRRPLSVRKRIIHSIRAETIDKNFFKLYLNTQAGTYIKEFVHGDFGRTTPNLGSFLGVKCDIIALDVEDVQLDWPPISK